MTSEEAMAKIAAADKPVAIYVDDRGGVTLTRLPGARLAGRYTRAIRHSDLRADVAATRRAAKRRSGHYCTNPEKHPLAGATPGDGCYVKRSKPC